MEYSFIIIKDIVEILGIKAKLLQLFMNTFIVSHLIFSFFFG